MRARFWFFSDYMRPAIRLAALMGLQVIYVFTHDSIGLGGDGPTHQPVEHLAALRAMPGLHVLRPADARETAECWQAALARTNGPSALVLSRQGLAHQPGTGQGGVQRGAYVLAEPPQSLPLQALVFATGSEVELAMQARSQLAENQVGVRVVNVPCWERFWAQPEAYRNTVLAAHVQARVAVEAAVAQGWERFLGINGHMIGMRSFGESAPETALYDHFGITVQAVVQAVKAQL